MLKTLFVNFVNLFRERQILFYGKGFNAWLFVSFKSEKISSDV